MRIIGERWPR